MYVYALMIGMPSRGKNTIVSGDMAYPSFPGCILRFLLSKFCLFTPLQSDVSFENAKTPTLQLNTFFSMTDDMEHYDVYEKNFSLRTTCLR